ncbi:hypothetical protein PIB30_018678 [Stylosanthes scabra]|uniref:Uncharacterized protein n=1 Tax=Stylosanthes scabra TaxID=79078 RepID=A0ABU6VAD5_9FABA|nr:hypothetical protein [Stylosanthes scabra]
MGAYRGRKVNGYSKLEKEDSEEKMHRRAQFLIYKELKKADSSRNKPCVMRIRMLKLKTKIGNTLRRINKRIFSSSTCGVIKSQVKALKKQFMIGRRKILQS